jgi:hypothetical protein
VEALSCIALWYEEANSPHLVLASDSTQEPNVHIEQRATHVSKQFSDYEWLSPTIDVCVVSSINTDLPVANAARYQSQDVQFWKVSVLGQIRSKYLLISFCSLPLGDCPETWALPSLIPRVE